MDQSLRILHLEDSKEDSELVRNLLKTDGLDCAMTRVESRPELFDQLEHHAFDLVLADCKLPNFDGMHALEIVRALKPDVPFIFVSGTIGEEAAIETLRNGATDYVMKDHLSRLGPAIRRALAEAEEQKLCHQLQQRLREAGRLEAIGTLSKGIAHDFNNILTIILGHASLLTIEHNRPERVLELTATITEAAQRAAEIVDQLMAFARKSEGHMSPVDLNRYIGDNLHQLKEKLPSRIDLTFQPAADLPGIMADASQLARILLNLITNSVDSMPKGGHITLSTQLVPAANPPNLLPDLDTGHYVCLKVMDTGAGMDSATQEHAFEPFYTTKERGRGTGLGLPVVYGLMQAHRGYVKVESELGHGTAFSLYFPVPMADTTKAAPVAHLADPSLGGSETILVVEDEPDVSFFLETMLQNHGYHVLTAYDHDEALKLFQLHQNQIQLVFSDIGLPRIDGIALCSKLKKMKPSLRVILASGYPPKEFAARMEQLNTEAFLPKPYLTRDILQSVRKALDGGKPLRPA